MFLDARTNLLEYSFELVRLIWLPGEKTPSRSLYCMLELVFIWLQPRDVKTVRTCLPLTAHSMRSLMQYTRVSIRPCHNIYRWPRTVAELLQSCSLRSRPTDVLDDLANLGEELRFFQQLIMVSTRLTFCQNGRKKHLSLKFHTE